MGWGTGKGTYYRVGLKKRDTVDPPIIRTFKGKRKMLELSRVKLCRK